MNTRDMLTIYDYNYWANRQILEACGRLSPVQFLDAAAPSIGSLRGTLVHTLDGEYAWRMLWQHQTLAGFGLMEAAMFPTVAALEQRWKEEERAMRDYLASLSDDDLNAYIRYTTPEDERRVRRLWHCLLHVVNHGTQHRSEAAVVLTAYGASPDDLDFTMFLNQQR